MNDERLGLNEQKLCKNLFFQTLPFNKGGLFFKWKVMSKMVNETELTKGLLEIIIMDLILHGKTPVYAYTAFGDYIVRLEVYTKEDYLKMFENKTNG